MSSLSIGVGLMDSCLGEEFDGLELNVIQLKWLALTASET